MPVERAWLEAAALFYLERYQASAESLRRVLMRRIWRRQRLERGRSVGEPEASEGGSVEAQMMVDALIDRYLAAGILDDRAFTRAKVGTLHRRGYSKRAIAVRLRAKGGERDLITHELAADDGELRPGGDLGAAVALARRRRLGPFRSGDHAAMAARDLAVLCRAGFEPRLARRVIGCVDEPALEDLIAESTESL
jgi:regulatory protein